MPILVTEQNPLTLRFVTYADVPLAPPSELPQLTGQMREGRDAAWDAFHGRYYVSLLRYAAAHTACPADAPEIVQQAYLRIARHIKVFRDENEFWRWLACVVRCAALDHQRGRTRRVLLLEKFNHWQETQREPSPSMPDTCFTSSVAQEALAKLPSADADLLRLKYYDGWSVQQLASRANTTSKAIENRLARLRQKVRDIILRIR